MKSVFAALVVVGSLAACGGDPVLVGPPAGATTTTSVQALSVYNWSNDPNLTANQKAIIGQLSAASGEAFVAQGWARGGSVGRLDLSVPSGLPGGIATAQALKFVSTNGVLWNLNANVQLVADPPVGADPCTLVTLHLKDAASGKLFFNATLTIALDVQHSLVKEVMGHLTGITGAINAAHLPATVANQIIFADQATPQADQASNPAATEVIFDPMFLADQPSKPVFGWLYSGQGSGPDTEYYLVDESTGKVAMRIGPNAQYHVPPAIVLKCQGANGTIQAAFTVRDPLTHLPAVTSFTHVMRVGDQEGGLKTDLTPGVTDVNVSHALNAIMQAHMEILYGDNDPMQHLFPQNNALGGAVARNHGLPGPDGDIGVDFQEYYGLVPIRGAGLTVVLNGTNALSIAGRYVYNPHIDVTPAVTGAQVTPQALAKYLSLECGTDQACTTSRTNEMQPPFPAVTPALVILSSAIYPQMGLGGNLLAYELRYPRSIIYWNAVTNLFLLRSPTVAHAASIQPWLYDATDNTQATCQGYIANAILDYKNGAAQVPAAQLNPDCKMIFTADWFGHMGTFYLGLDPKFLTNVDLSLLSPQVYVDSDFSFVPGGPNGGCGLGDPENADWWGDGENIMDVGSGLVVPDAVEHEYQHGISDQMGRFGMILYGETGALGESISDVMAECLNPDPDGHWTEPTQPAGKVAYNWARTLDNPHANGYPQTNSDPEVMCGGVRESMNGMEIHCLSTVPSYVMTQVAAGIGGAGRQFVAQLIYNTLVNQVRGESTRFLNWRMDLVDECGEMANKGTVITVPGVAPHTVTSSDCDLIRWKFDAVGITADVSFGNLFRIGQADMDGIRYYGNPYQQGCTLNKITVQATALTGEGSGSNDTATCGCPHPSVSLRNGEMTVAVTDSDPIGGAARGIKWHAHNAWVPMQGPFDVQFPASGLQGNVLATPTVPNFLASPPAPPGTAEVAADCEHGPDQLLRVMYENILITNSGGGIFGAKKDFLRNTNVALPANCVLREIDGIDFSGGGNVCDWNLRQCHGGTWGDPTVVFGNGDHGWAVYPNNDLTHPAPTVHTWYNGGTSGVGLDLVFMMNEKNGTNACVNLPAPFTVLPPPPPGK